MGYVEEFARAALWLSSGGLLVLMSTFAHLDAEKYQGRHVAPKRVDPRGATYVGSTGDGVVYRWYAA